jgi:putative ABC transport system permease protein
MASAWHGISSDARFALRSFARTPGVTAAVVVTLALGLGSAAAIYSVVNAVLLRQLPYADADRLVQIVENVPAEESPSGAAMRLAAMSIDDFEWWRTSSQTLSHVAVVIADNRTLVLRDRTERLAGATVSPDLFAMRGVGPLFGRGLVRDDERLDSGAVVIGEAAWQRYFAASPNVLGQTLVLDGEPQTIVGVMPAAFGREAYWLPFAAAAQEPGQFKLLPVTARLRDGVQLDAANAEIDVTGRQLRGLAPDPDPGAPPRFELVRELDQLTVGVAPALRVLVAAVVVLLLIVCANVANLLLARGMGRREELAMRRALGASRGRMARQLLVESALLASIAAALGLMLANGVVALLKALAAAQLPGRFASTLGEILPRLDQVAIDPAVLVFIAVVSLASAALFGAVPAVRLSRVGDEASPARARSAAGSAFAGHALATVQLALATTLLIAAGLLLNSFAKLAAVDLGFDARNVLAFELVQPGDYAPDRKLQNAEELVARLRTHPQVARIGFTDIAPLTPGIALGGGLLPVDSSADEVREDASLPVDQRTQQRYDGADYLRALGVRLSSGRWLDEGDGAAKAALVTRPFAERYFRDAEALGASIQSSLGVLTIVGVVDDVHLRGAAMEPERAVFVDPRAALEAMRASPFWQSAQADRFFLTLGTGSVAFAARTRGDPLAIAADVRSIARQIDPALAIDRPVPMENVVAAATMRPRFFAALLAAFGAVAAVVASVGIYGVLAYVVGRRTKEIGIRMALGAKRGAVRRLVLKQGIAMTALGVAAGLAGAAVLTRYLESLLFGLAPLDLPTYAAVAAGFGGLAVLASYVPARRATRIDPLAALRHE